MGKQIVKKEIDGAKFTFYYLIPRISTKLLIRLIKIIGPSFGKAFPDSDVKLKDIADIDIQIGPAVDALICRFDEDEVQDIIDILLATVLHEGQGNLGEEAARNELFTGNLSFMFKVVGAALEVQYTDFFGGKLELKNIIQKTKEIIKEDVNTIQEKQI